MLNSSFIAKSKRWLTRYSYQIKLVALAFTLSLLFILVYQSRHSLYQLFTTILKGPSHLFTLTQDPIKTLDSTNNRTNILLLGLGGEGHQGALLTDSMMVVSYNHETKQTHLLSLPRDLWIDSLKTKINATYYYGQQRQEDGGGLLLAKSAVSEVTGLPIHYGFAINFEGFEKAIDLVGGIDVHIDKAFDDYEYPIAGKENVFPESDRYEHLHFDAGLQHLDGATALKFVRSRHAEGDEGTDFARSHRQQLVILAFKDKLLSTQTLLNPQRLSDLFSLYGQYIDTDIKDTQYSAFAKLVLTLDRSKIKSIALTTGDEKNSTLGILENPKNRTPYQGQYVLIARDNNWEALKQYIQNELEK